MVAFTCAPVVVIRRGIAAQYLYKRFFRGDRKPSSVQAAFQGPGIPLLGDKFIEKNSTAVHSAKSDNDNAHRKWELFGAVCLERPPIISSDKTKTEEEFFNLLQRMEFEKSLYSDHEMSKVADAKKAKKKSLESDSQEEEVILETSQDREDRWNEEFEKFQPRSRLADPATDADFTSLERKLDQKLYLVVNQKLGKEPKWVFPQIVWQEGESLRQTADRALQATCGDQLNPLFLSNCPVGFYKYKYPASFSADDGYYGAKVFFFKALAKKCHAKPTSEIQGLKWVTRQELQRTVIKQYFDRIERFLFEFQSNASADQSHESLMKMHY